ncbi:MAG: urate hydroxylase PuuD [Alphaproteobacteria bacterium]|nr:urate hydroxylase PuuD [Alphaproteobacteria bacterium]
MLADLVPWLELALRWLHVITGIAWIGASFYFVWLDGNIRKAEGANPLVAGELWAVHGGGFYHNQKYLVAPETLPPHLHWFKYEAYFTWISGFLLLAVIYYLGAGIFLIDKAKLALDAPEAIAISVAFLSGGWIVYDGLCRSPLGQNGPVFGATWFAVLVVAAYALTHIFSDRAAFLHVGAIVGTAMVANVFFIIIPNQKKVVASMLAREPVDARLGLQAKQRSLHNNYMTLPVLLIMISNHYPMLYGSSINWLVLAGLSASGIMVRHVFNLRHKGELNFLLAFGAVLVFVTTMLITIDVQHRAGNAPTAAVPFAQARVLIDKHCIMCHAASPTHAGITAPPAGLDFTKDSVVQANAARIRLQVTTKAMPLGNETGMTDDERAALAAWINQGAHIP